MKPEPTSVRRLTSDDLAIARDMFALMAEVFGEGDAPLSDDYIGQLLNRKDFVAIGAFEDGVVVGGLTAHVLPMTRSQCSELFIYDLAVTQTRQRRGHATRLIRDALAYASERGIDSVFVPADNDDTHALSFYTAIGARGAQVTMFDFALDRNDRA